MGENIFLRWSIGLIGFSLILGWVSSWILLKILRHITLKKTGGKLPPDLGIPNWLIGLLERLFFTLIVAFEVSGTAVAMIGWLTLKMASNWHQISKGKDVARGLGIASLLAGVTSMIFALIGGLICSGKIILFPSLLGTWSGIDVNLFQEMKKIVFSLSYIFIILGSLGMIIFANKFSFSTRIKDLKLTNEKFLGLNGYKIWIGSWSLIIFGTIIQLVIPWIK
jgi:hypothetical protein